MTDIRDRLISAILNAVLDEHRGEGDQPIVVSAETVQDAMVVAMASIIEAAPNLRTNRDMRLAGEDVGKQVVHYLRALRQRYEETGHRIWDGEVVSLQ